MSEPEDDPLEALAAKAATRAGKDAAERAARSLQGKENAGRRWRLLVYGVLGLCLVLGVVGFVLSYWMYFLGAGVLGALGVLGYWRLRAKLAASREAKTVAPVAEAAPARARIEPAEAPSAALRPVEEAAAQARAQAQALAEARAADAQAVEDELAAMKARLRR